MALDLSTLTTEQQLAAIYIGYYDRAADPVGADFWEGAVANPNLSLADIATDFATQPETLIAYPFLDAPTAEEAEGFIAEVYLNLFNRAPDAAGLEFWSTALLAAIDGTGELSVGEIILAIIGGAQNSEDGQDLTTILNKIEVSTTWTSAADAAAIDYTTDSAAQSSAKSIIEGVTEEASTVVAAKSTIDNFFVPEPVPGEEFLLTSATDVIDGTADDDEFNAYIQQNPFAGGVSNSLASADRLDGGAGNDRLYAEITNEFVGVSGGYFGGGIDIQPRINDIEEIDIEARDTGFGFYSEIGGVAGSFGDIFLDGKSSLDGGSGEDFFIPVVVDGKNIADHEEIGSFYSDGDLLIENLTTLTSSGTARNTSEITITMDHTDNFNTDGDASDLVVLFDNDYLLSGQESEGQIFYFLLDEDAELAGLDNRLNNIDVDGLRFTIDTGNGPVDVTLEAAEANVAGTHQGFVNALQAPLQALIADGTLPAGTTLTLDPTITDVTFLDDGSQSDLIPAIVLTSGDGSPVIATGFSRIEEEIGEYDVYGRFNSINEVADQPISIDVDLHKVGRGGEGGNLIIGGKDEDTPDGIAAGIEVFNLNVLGAGDDDPNGGMTKPSNLGTVTSTGGELGVVNIATDPVFAAGDTYASLTIRDGFNTTGSRFETGDLRMIDANAFLGDLILGSDEDIINADMVTAMGGGNVFFAGAYDGFENGQSYTVMTGSGDDLFDINIDGDAVDAVDEGFYMDMGNGDNQAVLEVADSLTSTTALGVSDGATSSNAFDTNGVSQETTQLLMNLEAIGGSGEDYVEVQGMGAWDIDTNAGSDFVFINSGGAKSQGNLWNTTGLSDFESAVVYKAELAISVAGFESVVSIDTGSDFILTQSELNDAFIAAIAANPEIARLVTATKGTADQDLIITSLVDGVNEVGFQIRQPELVAAGTALTPGSAQVTLSAGDLAGLQRDLVATQSLFGTTFADSAAATQAAIIAAYADSVSTTDYLFGDTTDGALTLAGNTVTAVVADGYTGNVFTAIADAEFASGTGIGAVVNGSVINVGTGANDLAVLSARQDSFNVLVFDDLNAGKVSIVNWFDTGSTGTTEDLLTNGSGNQVHGNHLLDFTAFLTNQGTTSGSSASSDAIDVQVVATTVMEANSMHFLTVDALEAMTGAATGGYSFASLSASQLKALIEAGAAADANITYAAQAVSDGTAGSNGLVAGSTARTSIIAVENIDEETDATLTGDVLDNTNHGAYKFFQVIYGVGDETDTSTVTVNEITIADFGDSLNVAPADMEVNLIGTDDTTGNGIDFFA
jgi:hypothetical protein